MDEPGPRNPVWLIVIVWLCRSWRCALTKLCLRTITTTVVVRAAPAGQRAVCCTHKRVDRPLQRVFVVAGAHAKGRVSERNRRRVAHRTVHSEHAWGGRLGSLVCLRVDTKDIIQRGQSNAKAVRAICEHVGSAYVSVLYERICARRRTRVTGVLNGAALPHAVGARRHGGLHICSRVCDGGCVLDRDPKDVRRAGRLCR